MLNQETKRKIDSARDVLVGKVPDPKEQVEQITIALIYKFMDDIDKKAVEMGGKRKFFAGDYTEYAWTKLLDPKLGGQERLNFYSEGIEKMNFNKNIPQLFRDIFKGAFLPYRSPETLSLFLKEIDGLNYDHSEDLGDAYEYLLSILSSQGDAGQFRTPRHIIDFIVKIVDPKKNETILDPACGTAGFLISAYKHVYNENKKEKPGDKLTPDEKKKIVKNITGYDISPGMVRLSRVNMYLHHIADPKIFEYDTLSSEEKWDENFDVILANPPFMTPKGGIKPHKRFSIQANRSEVLFVDYIMEHLNPNGRAGIIVPAGIISTAQNAYIQLRKKLIEDGLIVVVSLPAGVFNPYSGVKTSILLFDNSLAKKTKDILFVKIENDGHDLGAQRRSIDKNDLPLALKIIEKYKNSIYENKKTFKLTDNEKIIAHIVSKEKIAGSGDYNLSGDRYKEAVGFINQKWPMVELGEVVELNRGVIYSKNDEVSEDGFKILRANNISLNNNLVLEDIRLISKQLKFKESQKLKAGDIFICLASGSKDHIGKVAFIKEDTEYYFGGFMGAIRTKSEIVVPLYIFYLLQDQKFNEYLGQVISGANIHNLNSGILSRYRVPLPPLEIQKEIVEQIEVKQKAIDAAKEVIKSLERERRYFGESLRKIKDLKWVELGEVAKVIAGQSPEGKYYNDTGEGEPFYQGKTEFTEKYIGKPKMWTSKTTKIAERGDILISVRAPVGPVNIATEKICIGRGLASIRASKIDQMFLFHFLKSIENEINGSGGAVFDSINKRQIEKIKIPSTNNKIQKQLVTEMEEQEKIVEANKKLIEIYEQKIKSKISELWQ